MFPRFLCIQKLASTLRNFDFYCIFIRYRLSLQTPTLNLIKFNAITLANILRSSEKRLLKKGNLTFLTPNYKEQTFKITRSFGLLLEIGILSKN